MPKFTEQHHVQIPYTDFHKPPIISVWKYAHKFTFLNILWHSLYPFQWHITQNILGRRGSSCTDDNVKNVRKTALNVPSNVRPSLDRSMYLHGYLMYRVLSKLKQTFRKQDGTSFTLLSKVRLSLHRFPWHPKFFSGITQDSLFRQSLRSVQVGTHLRSYVTHLFQSAEIPELMFHWQISISATKTNFKDIRRRSFRNTSSRTDGQYWFPST
jgi:hypothetical protein